MRSIGGLQVAAERNNAKLSCGSCQSEVVTGACRHLMCPGPGSPKILQHGMVLRVERLGKQAKMFSMSGRSEEDHMHRARQGIIGPVDWWSQFHITVQSAGTT